MKPPVFALPLRSLLLLVRWAVALTVAAASVAQAGGPFRRTVTARSLLQGFAVLPLAADELRDLERAFLNKSVELGFQQLRLAQVGLSQAERSEVRSHAMQLAADYRQLNAGLEALIRRKGGIAGAPVGGGSETYEKLIEESGADFDREFIRVVAALSDGALALFEKAAADAKDADVRAFAGAQLPMLREHRNRAIALKRETE